MKAGVVVHIPHASAFIPAIEAGRLKLAGEALHKELLRLTDWYTDELFAIGGDEAGRLIFPVSRLVVDPERFCADEVEPMTRYGMGAVYTRTSDGQGLRDPVDEPEQRRLLEMYYVPHHWALTEMVQEALGCYGRCLIIDAHSFPSRPLPCDLDQTPDRPDICLGTDAFHTPQDLIQSACRILRAQEWSVEIDRPYAGCLVPQRFYHRDRQVGSIMIEINRRLYMDEQTVAKLPNFGMFRERFQACLRQIIESWWA